MLVMYTPQQSTVKSGPAHVKSRNMYIPPGMAGSWCKSGKIPPKAGGLASLLIQNKSTKSTELKQWWTIRPNTSLYNILIRKSLFLRCVLLLSMVGHKSTKKSVVSWISKITVCWHFTAEYSSLLQRLMNDSSLAHGWRQSTYRTTIVRSRSISQWQSLKRHHVAKCLGCHDCARSIMHTADCCMMPVCEHVVGRCKLVIYNHAEDS